MHFTIEVAVWLAAFVVFLVVELISLGLTSIWFAGGAIVAAIAAVFGLPIWVQIVLFIIVTVLLFVFTRPVAQKHLNTKTEKTNAEGLIGEKARVIQTIDNNQSTGQVKINGLEWSARSTDETITISEGTMVIIREIHGVKLIVEKVE